MKNIIERALLWFQSAFDFRKIRYADERDMSSADVFFCQSGSPRKKGPTENDKRLAYLVFTANNQQIKPVIIHDNCYTDYIDKFDKKVTKLNFRDKYESTKECARYCLEHNYQKIALFTEVKRIRWTAKILEKFNLKVIIVDTSLNTARKSIPIFQRL